MVKLGTAGDDFFKKYDRKFIQLDRDTAMLIHLFEKDSEHSWEDVWLHDFTGVYEKDQLEGRWCIAFLEALRDECNKHIEEHREKCKKYENKN